MDSTKDTQCDPALESPTELLQYWWSVSSWVKTVYWNDVYEILWSYYCYCKPDVQHYCDLNTLLDDEEKLTAQYMRLTKKIFNIHQPLII